MTKKGRLGWFRHAEHKDDSDLIKCYTTIKLESGYARGIHDDVMEFMRSFDLSKEGVQIWNKWRKKVEG